MILAEHEYPRGPDGQIALDEHGRAFCLHCGAKYHAQMDATCLTRDVPSQIMPEPKRRIMACEDDSIAQRIAELRAEQDAAWNAEPEASA